MQPAIMIKPLTAEAFMPFGDVLSAEGEADRIINQGLCGRYHDRARMEFGVGRAGVSVFNAEPRKVPYVLEMMERHPLGSQCFMPMTEHPFLVTVAEDEFNAPSMPLAFLVPPHTGINFYKNTWHGVLTPLHGPGLFAVIDRINDDSSEYPNANLQEYFFDEPYVIVGQI